MIMFVKTLSHQYDDNDEYDSYNDDSDHYVMKNIKMMMTMIMAMMITMAMTLDISEV